MWFNIIKAPNPHGGQWKFLTREQYYEMNNKNKNNYHSAMSTAYGRQLNSLRARHQPLAAAPETLQNELIDLQKLRNFHGNQVRKIKKNEESVFSIEEDKNPPTHRLKTTPMGNIQHGEWDITEEEYNAATREEKMKYHSRKHALLHRRDSTDTRTTAHSGEFGRMKKHPNYTAPYNPEDAKSREEWQMTLYPIPSKEEYQNISNDDKRIYHSRMRHRSNEKDLQKFHAKMIGRLKRNSQLPTYYSPEEERNA